ncbi:MAG: hypothetical protein QOE33_3467 [Acidobacteriota bacterium]|nr:hypothetical protein [Acidobacteriota bacterium]
MLHALVGEMKEQTTRSIAPSIPMPAGKSDRRVDDSLASGPSSNAPGFSSQRLTAASDRRMLKEAQATHGNQAVLRALTHSSNTDPVTHAHSDADAATNNHVTFSGQTGGGSGSAAKSPTTQPATPAPAPQNKEGQNAPAPPASTSSETVDRIDIVDSASGATTGFQKVKEGDLNVPGPYNNPKTGGVSHALQVHFHLDKGDAANLTPKREIQMSASAGKKTFKNPPDQLPPAGQKGDPTPGGFEGSKVAPDGPRAHEIMRPTAKELVAADAPGTVVDPTKGGALYPVSIKAHFTLTVADKNGKDIARTRYDVLIEKTDEKNIPNKQNELAVLEKKDLVRGKDL